MGIPYIELNVDKGRSLLKKFRWSAHPLIYKPITGASNTAPCRINCQGHGLPPDYAVAITGVKGMTQINSVDSTPCISDYKIAKVIDANTLDLRDVNATGYGSYLSGGVLQYYTPVDMAGMTATLQARRSVQSTSVVLELSTANNGIILDNTYKYIYLVLTEEQTYDLPEKTLMYDLFIGPPDAQIKLFAGTIKPYMSVTRNG